jgi:glycosyltransferase involved in cell wall biosynthesis
MKISVIVNTKNSERTIRQCLDSIFSQTYENFETILVDANSKDETLQIASSYSLKIVAQDKGNLARARNIGLLHSTGDIVAFLDSDATAGPDWLQRIASRFKEGEVAVVGGPDEPPKGSNTWEQAVGIVDAHIIPKVFEWGSAELITGCNVAYRRIVLERVGFFNEELDTAEETELNKRIMDTGARLVFDKQIKVLHYKRSNPSQYFRQHLWYGVGKGQMLRHNGHSLKLSNVFAPPFLALPCILVWLVSTGFFNLTMGVVLLFALVTLVVASHVCVKSQSAKLVPVVAASVVIWIYSEALGQLLGLFFRESRS